MIKKILIVGATGFIGSNLVDLLLQKKYELIILKRSFDDIKRIKHLTNQVKLYDIDKIGLDIPFSENKIDLVINLATDFGRNPNTLLSQVFETNVLFGLKLIEVASNNKVNYYFNIDSSLSPKVSLYAYTKSVYKYTLEKYFASKIKICNLKLEYVLGENDDLSKLIPFIISEFRENKAIDISPGEQDLDFIYVKDVVDAFLYIIMNSDSKINYRFTEFEVGTGKTTKLKDLLEMIKKEMKSNSIINYSAISYRENEQMFSKADLSALGGWKPKYNIKQVIKLLIK